MTNVLCGIAFQKHRAYCCTEPYRISCWLEVRLLPIIMMRHRPQTMSPAALDAASAMFTGVISTALKETRLPHRDRVSFPPVGNCRRAKNAR